MRKVIALLLTVLLLGSLATAVFAAPSVVAPVEFEIEIILDLDPPEDGGKVTVKEGEEYVLTPPEKEGYEFDKYVIEGEYEIVKKDGDKWTIIPKSDLVIHVKYKGVEPKPVPHDDKPVSPSTGDNSLFLGILMVVGLCGVVLATRKLVKTH